MLSLTNIDQNYIYSLVFRTKWLSYEKYLFFSLGFEPTTHFTISALD